MDFGPKVFAICDWEMEFGVRLMEYIQEKKRMMFEMHVFTEVENLCAYAEKRKISVLLIADQLMCDEVRKLPVERVVILTEGFQKEKFDDYPYVYKYQPADRLMREVLKNYQKSESVAEGERVWRRRKNIFAVCSPALCRNKLFFTVALGRVLSREYRVLYINLEGISGLEVLAGEHLEQNLSDLIYMYRRSKEGIIPRLRSMTGSIVNMEYIAPVRAPEDILSVSPAEISELLQIILEKSDYEVILLDLDAGMPYMPAMLELVDKLFQVTEEDSISKARNQQFESMLQAGNCYLLRDKVISVELSSIRMQREGKRCFEEVMRNNIGMAAEQVLEEVMQGR